MSLQNSPGFDQVELDDVSHPPEPKNRRGVVWGMIIVLVLIVIGLAVLNIWGGAEITALRGVGSLSGFVVDEKGNGVQAEIIVAGTNLQTMTDESGKFLLADIPEGQRLLVVGYDQTGWEYPVTVIAGQTMDVGRVSVVTTETPD